jgi:diguanylate cyclase (GGDEF)-like protein
MKLPNKNRKYGFLTVGIALIALFIIMNWSLAINVQNHYIQQKEKEGMAIGEAYADRFAKVILANKMSENLLNDDMEVALHVLQSTLLRHPEFLNSKELNNLAHILKLDVIYLYDESLTIVASVNDQFIGWQAGADHPIIEFYTSDVSFFLEPTRKDYVLDEYFKFGYIHLGDDYILQIGKNADAIAEMTKAVDYRQSISEMVESSDMETVYFITMLDEIIAFESDVDLVDLSRLEIEEIRQLPISSRRITFNKERFVDVFVPLNYYVPEVMTVMVMRYSLKDTYFLILNTFLSISAPASILYIGMVYFYLSRFRANQRLVDIVYLDVLTGLNNRLALQDQVIDHVFKEKKQGILIFVDCKDFRYINKSFGFETGDLLFEKMGTRFKQLSAFDSIYRFSGNMFVFYINDVKDNHQVEAAIEMINHVFAKPFAVKNFEIKIDVYMSAMAIQNYDNFDDLLKDSNYALGLAKKATHRNYVIFDDTIANQVAREASLLDLLEQAIAQENYEHLYCEFQPIVSLNTHDVVALEALVRLKDKTGRVIYPNDFISLAEENQLIIPLGKHVLKYSCMMLNQLINKGFDNIRIGLNVSAIEMLQEDYVNSLLATMHAYDVDPEYFTLEITESILLSDFTLVNQKFQQLQAYGVRIALDDFGIGYSSFERLHNLNIDILKIDKQFVDRIKNKRSETVVVADIISMAHKFGLIVVGEGVDDQQQKDYLEQHGCDMMQGYLFSKPLKAADIFILLEHWQHVLKKNNGNHKQVIP